MALVHLVDIGGSLIDISAYAPRLSWTARLNAEEGSVGSWEVEIDDPLAELEIVGHRRYFIEDDESEDEDDIIFGGYTGGITLARLGSTARRRVGTEARVITVMLVDANSVLARVSMKGSDTDRPIETDVERMQWLLTTSEATTSELDDVTTFVDTSAPVAMDKVPYRGTYFGQIITDCAQQSGKNFFAWWRKVSGTRTLTLWYGKDSLPDYESPFFITNDRVDFNQEAIDDGTATVWQLSNDAKLVKNYDRQYDGNYLTYAAGATYRHNTATHAISAHRDMTTNAPLVKTKAKAQARADRMLNDVSGADYRITTRLEGIPQDRVSLCKAGHLLQVKGTHWAPDIDGWRYARVVTAQPRPRHVGRFWDIDLELVLIDPDEASPGPEPPDFTGVPVFAGLQRSRGNDTDQTGPLKYSSTYEIGGGGWYTRTSEGPLSIVPGVPNPEADGLVYDSVLIDEAMTVRIHARAHVTGVYIPATVAVLNIRVNGGVVGTSTVGIGPGFAGGTVVDVDLRDFHVSAGDVISIDSAGSGLSDAIFWTNNGVNDTYLHVARGEVYTDDLSQFITEGP